MPGVRNTTLASCNDKSFHDYLLSDGQKNTTTNTLTNIPMLPKWRRSWRGDLFKTPGKKTYILLVWQRRRGQEEAPVHLGGPGQSNGRALVQDLGGCLVLVVCVTGRRYGPITVSL